MAAAPAHADAMINRNNVTMKQEMIELEIEGADAAKKGAHFNHDTDMVKAINRFRYQLVPGDMQLKEYLPDANEWTDIINGNRGEEALIKSCSMFEYFVRRALVAIRVNNTGFMGTCSLLRIIDNGVATSQFCRLTKAFYAESCFSMAGHWPSKAKLRENDSDGENVIRELRSMTEDQIKPDFKDGTKKHLWAIYEIDLRRRDTGDSGWLFMNRFIDLYMQAMNKYASIGPQRDRYKTDLFDRSIMRLYNMGPISTWGISDANEKFAICGITETTSQIQTQCGIRGSNEEMIKRLCRRTTVFILFIEACVIKSTFNKWKLSNSTNADVMFKREVHKWNSNIEYITSQKHTF